MPTAPARGQAWVRLAQLRGRIAAFARGGDYAETGRLLGDLVRAELALGLPADALQRARQTAALAEAHDEPTAGPLLTLAATLLAADDPRAAIDGARAAFARASDAERPRTEICAQLVIGSAHRRLGAFVDARDELSRARAQATKVGDAALAALALAELAWVDHAEGAPLAAAANLEFAAEFFRRAASVARAADETETAASKQFAHAAAEADTLCVASFAAAKQSHAASVRAARTADVARALGRPELVAFLDGELADLALTGRTTDDASRRVATEACALAAESADALPTGALSRDLRATARLRQARASSDAHDRARHLELGIDLALGLPHGRAGLRLGGVLLGLLDDSVTLGDPPRRAEISQLHSVLVRIENGELAQMAAAVLQELG